MRLAPLYEQDREQAIQKGRIEGIQEGEAKLVLRLLNRRFGEFSPNITETIQQLSVEQLENLGEALLDFDSQADLVNWLHQE